MDSRLTDVNKALKEINLEIEDWEWAISEGDPEYLSRGPDALQVLYLQREQLQHALEQGDLYVPNF